MYNYKKYFIKYLKNYGFIKTVKTIYYYAYRVFNQPNLKSKTEKIVDVNGYKLSVVPDDPGISSELRIFNIHEPLTTQITQKILKKGMTCLDIGGNIGYYVLMESKAVGNKGKVIAMEPSPKNYQYLKKNVDLAKVKNVELFNFAAGDKDDQVKFLLHEKSNLCSVIPDGKPMPSSGQVITIPLKRIDSFIQNKKLQNLDFLRMDVEGYELKVFEGLWNSIQKFMPIIQMEFHEIGCNLQERKKFFQKLKSIGYEIKFFIPRDLDRPITGDRKDIKNYSISDVIDMWEKRLIRYNFIIFLENNS